MNPRIAGPLLSLCVLGGTAVFSQAKKPVQKKAVPQTATKPAAATTKEEDEKPSEVDMLEPAAIDTSAVPDDELTAEIRKMNKATGSMEAATSIMKQMIEEQKKNPNPQVPAEFYDRFLAQINSGRVSSLLENAIIKVYREKFTVEEIKQLTAFYATPVGKKVAAELPSISARSEAAGEELGKYIAMQIVADMMKEGKWK
ncbi:MAG: DUF2059 domain-containing protein [Chitinophagaceae bacterium]